MTESTYETMDWEAEAARITAAFGIPVSLRAMDKGAANNIRYTDLSSYPESPEAEVQLSVQYRSDGDLRFDVYISGKDHQYALLALDADGTVWRFQTNSPALRGLLVEGLSDLGLMTAEIERAMKASFTSHEELECLLANRPAMEFEAIDWEAEAARFVVAFDVEEKCKFVRVAGDERPYYYLSESGKESGAEADEFVLLSNGLYMSFLLYPDAYYFFIGQEKQRRKCKFVGIHRDGTVLRNIDTDPLYIVAEGVFNLGLYSPEVEVAFKGIYFQRSKQGWEAEHKARLAGERKNPVYDSMDREAETKRIVAAFEVVEPCQFHRHADTTRCLATERMDDDSKYRLLLKSGLSATVIYKRQKKLFRISQSNPSASKFVRIGWDGSDQTVARRNRERPTEYVIHALAKALFFLDLLTPEIEAAIDASISAHERVEWALEYEARNGVRNNGL